MASAIQYHAERNSIGLLIKVIDALAAEPDTLADFGIMTGEPTAMTTRSQGPCQSALSRKTIRQMCLDIDLLLSTEVDGCAVATRALSSFGLWMTVFPPEPSPSSRDSVVLSNSA